MSTLAGKVVAITGANAGIGKETAVALARMGATVVMTARDPAKGAAALAEVRERSGSTTVDLVPLDLASFESIRGTSAALLDRYDRLDVLVANAGLVMSKRTETVEGFETTFGVNHLGHFYLTSLLFDRLRTGDPSRVVVVSSTAHKMVRARARTSTTCSPLGTTGRSTSTADRSWPTCTSPASWPAGSPGPGPPRMRRIPATWPVTSPATATSTSSR